MKKIFGQCVLSAICLSGFYVTGCRSDSSAGVSEVATAAEPASERLPGTRWQATYKWGFGSPMIELQRIDDEGRPATPNFVQQLKECGFGPVVKCSNDVYRVEIKSALASGVLLKRRGGDPINLLCGTKTMDIAKKPYVCTE